MKTHNTDAVHQIDVTRGRKNTNRAGSQGISVLDATGTNVHPITDLLFGDGFTVTDGDDGMAIVNASSPFPGDDPAPAGTPTVTVESTAGTSATVNVPAGVVDGMVMILAIWKDDNASVSTGVAAGWTEIVQGTNGSFFVRVADNEPASYNVSYGPTNRRAVVSITAFENVDTVTPIGGFSTAGDVSLSLPNADYYLLASIELNRGDVTFGAPTGWTMLAEGDTGGSGTDHVAAALAGKAFSGSEAEGPITFDIDIGDADANTQIALRRASAVQSLQVQVDALDRVKSEVRVSHLLTATTFPIVAHRGDINPVDGYPENTVEAVRQAAVRGAHAVEMDVQRSSDGTWHLLHDLDGISLDRTTNLTGDIGATTDAALAAGHIDGGFGYDAGRHGTSLLIPTLDSALEAILAYDVVIWFDLKEYTDEAGETLAQYIRDAGLVERAILLNPINSVLEAAKGIAPNLETATFTAGEPDPQDFDYIDRGVAELAEVTGAAFAIAAQPKPIDAVAAVDTYYGDDERDFIEDMWGRGVRMWFTNDLPNALLYRNELVLGGAAANLHDEPLIASDGTVMTDGLFNPLMHEVAW